MARNKKVIEETFLVGTSYLGAKIDIKKIQENIKRYRFMNSDQPTVIQLAEGQYAVLTRFGTVTFWNVSEKTEHEFITEIYQFIANPHKGRRHSDSLKVYIGSGPERMTFEEIHLKEIDVEKIKMISYVSAQSVALDKYEDEIDQRLIELGRVVDELKDSGKTHHSQQSLLKQVGTTLSVKQSAVSSLSLLDKPDAAWDIEEIEKLYDHLRDAYELRDRFDILNEKIDFLSENNSTLLDAVSSQRSYTLEIIVVVLIVIEIVLFVAEMMKFPR